MTPADLQAIDEERREREDELLLLLLLLLARSVELNDNLATFDGSLLRQHGAGEIAQTMADAHADGARFYAGRPSLSRAELVRQYEPAAQEMVDAMVLAILATGQPSLGDALVDVRYTRSDSTGLRLGAERQVTTAGNAGLVDGFAARFGTVAAFRHVSVVDDRTTDICRGRHNLTLAVTNPYWLTNWPSLHWNCRSIVEPLGRGAVLTERVPSLPSPEAGFGIAPASVVRIVRGARRSA